MDYEKTIFIPLSFWESDKSAILAQAQKSGYSQISLVVPYENREAVIDTADTILITKSILLSTPNQAQTYTQLRKGKTNAGEVSCVIYEPDFTSKTVETDIRKICEKGWCDAILNLEQNPQKDGLHKKKHYFTQVEAKLVAENNITILFTQANLTAPNTVPFILNRVTQLLTIGKKYNVDFEQIIFAQTLSDITVQPNSSILDVLSRKTI